MINFKFLVFWLFPLNSSYFKVLLVIWQKILCGFQSFLLDCYTTLVVFGDHKGKRDQQYCSQLYQNLENLLRQHNNRWRKKNIHSITTLAKPMDHPKSLLPHFEKFKIHQTIFSDYNILPKILHSLAFQ